MNRIETRNARPQEVLSKAKSKPETDWSHLIRHVAAPQPPRETAVAASRPATRPQTMTPVADLNQRLEANRPQATTAFAAPSRSATWNFASSQNSGEGDGLGGIVDWVKDRVGLGDDDSKRAEDKDENATIAVFDNFNDADDDGVNTHGEQVEGVIMEEGGFSDEDIQRFQIGSGGNLNSLKEGLADGDEEAFTNYIEDRYTGLLDNTSDGLEEILEDEDSEITVINQSQSVAEARIARDLWNEAKDDEAFRADLAQSLGLDADVSDQDLAQALVDGIGETVASSDAIAESQQRYDEVSQRVAEAGIAHVITSGNLGGFADELDRLGVETDRQFYDSALVNEHKIVVAATDDGFRPADFNSPHANADISAPGVDIRIESADGEVAVNSGTSFAAPAVAAAVAQIQAENPDLTPAEIEALLVENADRVKGPSSDIGAGNLDVEEALAAA